MAGQRRFLQAGQARRTRARLQTLALALGSVELAPEHSRSGPGGQRARGPSPLLAGVSITQRGQRSRPSWQTFSLLLGFMNRNSVELFSLLFVSSVYTEQLSVFIVVLSYFNMHSYASSRYVARHTFMQSCRTPPPPLPTHPHIIADPIQWIQLVIIYKVVTSSC